MIERILAATDFSKTSESALKWTSALALVHQAEVRLVHALLLPSHPTPYLPPAPSFDQELQQKVASLLEEAADGLRTRGVKVSTDLAHGTASQAIIGACEEWQADLAVVGTRGLSGWQHLLLGSTAERVISAAPCPVLGIHPGDQVPSRPIRKILIPTDFSDESRRAAEVTLDLLAPQAKGELLIAHGFRFTADYGLYGMGTPAQVYLDSIEESARRELESWTASLEARDWTVHTRLVAGAPYEVIARLAEEEGVDLVAMGTHGHGRVGGLLLGNTARRTLQHATCPVLTVRKTRRVPKRDASG